MTRSSGDGHESSASATPPLGGKHSLLGYLVLRGQVIGTMMLGRTGGPFWEDDIDRVAELLPALAVGRASYGLPGLTRAPPRPASPKVRWPWREQVLARRLMGEVEVRVRDAQGYARWSPAISAQGGR